MNSFLNQLYLRLRYKKSFGLFSLMKKYQYRSIDENVIFQKEKLDKLLKYAAKNVPYYRKVLAGREAILENFPILNKKIIKENFSELKAENYKSQYIKNTSGGSTGEPAVFLQDQNFQNAVFANKMFFYDWAGFKMGQPLVKLWGSEKEILDGNQGLIGFFNKKIMDTHLLNSFLMSDEIIKKYIVEIAKIRPKLIEAYVQSIDELSRFAFVNKLKVFQPQSIMVSAGTLYSQIRENIKRVFNCPVFNRYGSREVGDMASSCEKEEGLHVNIFTHYLEILDNNFNEVGAGGVGNIYVTALDNYVMPLIRYDIGDMAEAGENALCGCGRGLPLIKRVIGRSINMFKNKKGEMVDGEYFTHLLYFKDWIKKFQVLQKSLNNIEYRIILAKDKNLADLAEIEEKTKRVMGNDCSVEFIFLDKIEPTKSGKYLYTISEVK